ncbi:MKI67 FHA domain-interacting nucleolar phosphoprotein [Actinomortierella ambigua]|nr:MKI67 FHA domain-interacting nucleolar phosphoprotein [Actinomortierella ambigua]
MAGMNTATKATTKTAAKRKAAAPAEKQAPTKRAATGAAKKVVQAKVVEKKQPARAAKKASAPTAKPTKKDTKPAKAAPVAVTEDDEDDEEEEEEEEQNDQKEDSDDAEEEELMDDQALLKGIDSSAEEDSSDDEEADAEDRAAMKEDSFAAMKDTISLDAKTKNEVKKKLDAIQKKGKGSEESTTGTVYLGRIPHGFYEEQMQAYFSQFGKVLRLRLSRNKKTGRSKHYAFIEFTSPEVAEIVADTMNNYLLFGHQLKCKALAKNQIHPSLFEGANRKFKPVPWMKIAREKHNAEKTPEQVKQINRKLLQKESAKRAKLQELGIDYDFPGYKAQVKAKPKHTKF